MTQTIVDDQFSNVKVDTFEGLLVEYDAPKRSGYRARYQGGLRLRIRAADGIDEPTLGVSHQTVF